MEVVGGQLRVEPEGRSRGIGERKVSSNVSSQVR